MALRATAIETERLILEALREDHAAEMVQVLADPVLYEFTGGEPPSLDELERRYRAQVAGPQGSEEIWCNWILRQKDGGRAVGFVQATVTGSAAELAWLIEPEAQGQGLAREAALAMSDWLVAAGVAQRSAHIHPAHVASERVARSIGLSQTGLVDDDGERIWSHP